MDTITVRKETGQPSESPTKAGSKSKRKFQPGMIVLALVAVIGFGAAGVFYWLYQDASNNPEAVLGERNTAETERVLTKLKGVLRIDETEAPTVARVDNPMKLKETNKDFYANVEQGDYLILYPKRAIIFRESNNQVINVAPIINTSQLKPADEKKSEGETDNNN